MYFGSWSFYSMCNSFLPFPLRVSKWLHSKNEHFTCSEWSVQHYWTDDVNHHSPGWWTSSPPFSFGSRLPYDRELLSDECHSRRHSWHGTERGPEEGMIVWCEYFHFGLSLLSEVFIWIVVCASLLYLCFHYALWGWSSSIQLWTGASNGMLWLVEASNWGSSKPSGHGQQRCICAECNTFPCIHATPELPRSVGWRSEALWGKLRLVCNCNCILLCRRC